MQKARKPFASGYFRLATFISHVFGIYSGADHDRGSVGL